MSTLCPTEESQITEIEGKGLICDPFSLPCDQSLLSSAQDSIESIATPQEADLDDEQIRALLASPPYSPEREASAERSQVYHSEKNRLDVQFISRCELHRHLGTCRYRETCRGVFTSE